jgi:hypothetical protein
MRTIFIFLVLLASLSNCSAFSFIWKLREVSKNDDKAEQGYVKDSDGCKTKKIDTGNPWYHRRQRKREAKAYEDMMVGLNGGLRPLSLKRPRNPVH